MSTTAPSIVYGIFCEFVRAEASGQVTPVGIWGDVCKVPGNAPQVLPSLAFYAFVRNPKGLKYEARLKMKLPGQEEAIELRGVVDPRDANESTQNLIFGLHGIEIKAPGDIVAELSLDSSETREFRLTIAFA